MPYSPTDWVDGVTPLDAANFDKIEAELVLLDGLPRIPTVVNGQWLKGVGGVPVWSALAAADIPDISATYQATSQKAAANGYASLGSDGKVPTAQLPAIGGATLVTSLPGSPTDGQEVVYVDSLTDPTYAWLLRYIAAKATNKWVYIGGSALRDEVLTQQSTSSSAYVALGTAGPSIVIPVAGDYEVALGATISNATDQGHGAMSYDIGATAAADADYIASTASGTDTARLNSAHRVKQKSLGAVTLTAKYRSRTTTVTHFANRYMSVVPVAIGG